MLPFHRLIEEEPYRVEGFGSFEDFLRSIRIQSLLQLFEEEQLQGRDSVGDCGGVFGGGG